MATTEDRVMDLINNMPPNGGEEKIEAAKIAAAVMAWANINTRTVAAFLAAMDEDDRDEFLADCEPA